MKKEGDNDTRSLIEYPLDGKVPWEPWVEKPSPDPKAFLPESAWSPYLNGLGNKSMK